MMCKLYVRPLCWFIMLGLAWSVSSLASENEPTLPENAVPTADSSAAVDKTTIAAVERDPSWLNSGRLVLGGRFSADIQESFIDSLLPLWKEEDSALFLNLRGSFLEDREQEANVGVVYRNHLSRLGVVVGLNAFYDQRWTENDNRFDQIGGGVEVLSRWIDARFNYYLPLKDEVVLDEYTTSAAAISGGQRVTTFSTFRQVEEALEGFDAEVGVWLPGLHALAPTALFVGYYDFNSDYAEDDLSGWKIRMESRITSQFTLDAEWFESDEINGTDYFVGFRVHLPLDVWNGIRLDRRGGMAEAGLAGRLNEMVYRDFRIRTRVSEPVLVGERSERSAASSPRSGPTAPSETQPPPPPCRPSIDLVTGEVIFCD